MGENFAHSYQRLRNLFLQAHGLSEDERGTFLDRECAGDTHLRRKVEALLVSADEPDSLLDHAAADQVTLSEVLASDDPAVWEEFLRDVKRFGPDFERFADQGEVARGGMGSIHRVKDRSLRRTLAMKVILASDDDGSSGSSAFLGRFLEEAQVTGQLDHPGIVPVYDIGLDDQARVYFTMKLVKGEDLRSVFDRVHDPNDDGWNETRALNTLLRVCEAMAYAHDKGVIHRDLKPSNVMVGKHGETYVMDWGLAKIHGQKDTKDLRLRPFEASSLIGSERKDAAQETPDSPLVTMDGDVVGTPSYMAPEQALGKVEQMGPHSDVYALGAMLYHLVTGRMPYVEPGARISARTILGLATQGPPPAIHTIRNDCPAELQAVCEKAMSREIAGRYPDMTALSRDLRAYLENRVVTAYESGAVAELKKWVKRNKGTTATALAGVIVISLLTVWFLLNLSSKERTALAERARAEARGTLIDQLAGVVRLETTHNNERDLYPAWPATIPEIERWLAEDVARLLELKPTLRQTLAEMEGRSLTRLSPEDPVRFPGESEQFLYDTLADVRDKIAAFEASTLRDAHQRLSWARRINDLTRDHPNAIYSWEEAREAIAAADGVLASELYAEHPIDLVPQMGLVPIGMNPVTLLWEFYHLRSAWDSAGDVAPEDLIIPEHRDDGGIEVADLTGIVLVLVPGGSYVMGAQPSDPDSPHYDPQAQREETPVHQVVLEPYFISRYELTQGQWKRFTGKNPSNYVPESSLTHPVEQVSWEDCMLHLPRNGLRLPSEAQWEAACRAGTTTPWWTGSEPLDLDDAGNLSDQSRKRQGNESSESWEQDLDERRKWHSRVGQYRANPFGLHDVIGNVMEWCLDDYDAYENAGREGDGARLFQGAHFRVCRGGGVLVPGEVARSALRSDYSPTLQYFVLGCRPARDLITE